MPLERETILHNRYRILEILGEGGMGAVYRAYDENLGVTVAVKENLFTTKEYARQFLVEAKILASLRHPNLTRVTDHFQADKIQYLVMDYIEGEDLRDRMDRLSILDETEAITIGIAICEALTYLHTRDPVVLHRDIKPGNVKISPAGQIFLVDFGLAKVVRGDQMTVTGARAMTPGFSPPEQYGTARTDVRTDIYSLGATLYAALTGELPEDGLARAMNQLKLTPLRKYNPEVSRKLAGVIENSLSIQPDDRFQRAEDFKKALINTRGITRRRINLDNLLVSPPPELDVAGLTAQEDAPQSAETLPPNGIFETPVERPAGSPVPRTEQISGPEPGDARGKKGSGCLARLVLALIILVGAAVGAYFLFPEQSSRAMALILPATPTATQTHGPEPSATPTNPPPSETPTPSPTGTPAPTSTETTIPATPTNTATQVPSNTPSRTPTPLPTPLGGGGKIAFASDRTGDPQIYIINVDGTGLQRVTDIEGGACQPDWSPGGERLLFISPCPGEQEEYSGAGIFIINTDGTGLVPVTSFPNGDYDPDWSPDGSRFVFTSLRNNEPQVFLFDLVDNSTVLLAEDGVKNMQPAWLKDGSKIAFITTRKGPFQVWIMDPDGANQARFSRSSGLKNTSPDWSPEGNFIIFAQRELPNGVPVLVRSPLESDGLSEFRLTSETSPSRAPAYSPDGRWVVFESWPDGENHDIYLLDLNTLEIIRITTDPGFDFDPDWHPGEAP